MNYYIYVYLDPRKTGRFTYSELGITFLYEPFYVGKGKNNRYLKHLKLSPKEKQFNTHKSGKIDNIINEGYDMSLFIVKYKQFLSEDEAFTYEIAAINIIGRKDLNKGPLTNQSAGGKGSFDKGDANISIRKKHLKSKFVMSDKQKALLSNLKSMAIKQIDKKTMKVIKIWKNAKVAAFDLNIKSGAIYAAVKEGHPTKSAGGFYWEYVDRPNKKYANGVVKYNTCRGLTSPRTRRFIILNMNTNETKEIYNITQFCKDNNIHLKRFRYSVKSKLPQHGWVVIS